MGCPRLLLLLLLGGCSGCSLLRITSLTESAPMVIPGHTDRNQFSGQVGYGGKRGLDGSASYSLTKHLAVSGTAYINYQSFQNNIFPGLTSPFTISINSHYVEGQAAWFWVNRHSISWALAGGYGGGFRALHWWDKQLEARFNRYSIQASGSWRLPDKTQISVGIKLHRTLYTAARSQGAIGARYPENSKTLAENPRDMYGVDMVQTVRVPLSPLLMFSGQVGYYLSSNAVQLVAPDKSIDRYGNVGFIISAGLALSLPVSRH